MDPDVDQCLAVPDAAALVTARLAGFVAARQRWLSGLTAALDADPRVMGVWLVGSCGRGESDVWSDLDVVVAAEPGMMPAIAADPVAALGVPGSVLFRLAVARNTPAGGAYLGVCVELAGLPL
jgi:predicted nucleotidyltransferase